MSFNLKLRDFPDVPSSNDIELLSGDKIITRILRELEKIKKSNGGKKTRRCEELILFILSSLRKRDTDHLQQTTAVWALMNILRVNTNETRVMMLQAGVPSILYNFLASSSLTPTTMQYASELIFFLCSEDPTASYPKSLSRASDQNIGIFFNKETYNTKQNHPRGKNVTSLVEEEIIRNNQESWENQLRSVDEDGSVITSVSSIRDDPPSLLVPFVPYRVSKANMKKIGDIFSVTLDPLGESGGGRVYGGGRKRRLVDEGIRGEDDFSVDASNSTGISSIPSSLAFTDPEPPFVSAAIAAAMRKDEGLSRKAVADSGPNSDSFPVEMRRPPDQEFQSGLNANVPRSLLRTAALDAAVGNVGDAAVKQPSGHHSPPIGYSSGLKPGFDVPKQDIRKQNRPLSVPALPQDTRAASLQRLTVVSGLDPSDFHTSLMKLDPLAANLSVTLKAQAKQESSEYLSKVTLTSRSGSAQSRRSSRAGGSRAGSASSLSRKKALPAERLINLEFCRRLFTDKMPLESLKDIIRRMTDLLELFDKDSTGRVSWECFARILLAVSPPNLLRAHVVEFMEAQTDSMSDLVDYREFVISGKVLIVQRSHNNHGEGDFDPPISSWMVRQKAISGDRSTYSWKNHIEWYRARKSQAVIWLMRRAGRAVQYSKGVVKSAEALKYAGVRARVLCELIEIGQRGKLSFERRLQAERALIMRCQHARRWRLRQMEALRWLQQCARAELTRAEDLWRKQLPAPPKMATIYRVYWERKLAAQWLRKCGTEALARVDKKFIALIWLKNIGRKAAVQIEVIKEVYHQLVTKAEVARTHCTKQDIVLLSLIRLGREKALPLLVRQDASLKALLSCGSRAKAFSALKSQHYEELSTFGARKLKLCNQRDAAFRELVRRRNNATNLLVRKKEALEFLLKFGRGLWAMSERRDETQAWLSKRAKRAIVHTRQQNLALRRLKFVAQRGFMVTIKLTTAYADLREVGLAARYAAFEKGWMAAADYRQRVKDEEKLILAEDKKRDQERSSLADETRWLLELREAFDLIGSVDPATEAEARRLGSQTPAKQVGKMGFRRLLLEGKLLFMSRDALDEQFAAVDRDGSGLVSFEEMWPWFLHEAVKVTTGAEKKPKPIKFSCATILTVRQRAIINLMRKYNAQLQQAKAEAISKSKSANSNSNLR